MKSEFEIKYKVTLHFDEKKPLDSCYTCDECGQKLSSLLTDSEMGMYMEKHLSNHPAKL